MKLPGIVVRVGLLVVVCVPAAGTRLIAQDRRYAWLPDPEEVKRGEVVNLFEEIRDLYSDFEIDRVRVKIKELEEKYPEVRKTRVFNTMTADMAVIGTEAGELEVVKWFQGETTFSQAPVTLVVFWESWCPHCQDDMPRIQELFERFREQGLNVIGLTRISKPGTTTSVFAFIGENELTFSIAKDSGTMSERFGVERVPAAAIVKDGKVIWRGYSSLLRERTIEKSLAD